MATGVVALGHAQLLRLAYHTERAVQRTAESTTRIFGSWVRTPRKAWMLAAELPSPPPPSKKANKYQISKDSQNQNRLEGAVTAVGQVEKKCMTWFNTLWARDAKCYCTHRYTSIPRPLPTQQPNVVQGRLVLEVPKLHTITHHDTSIYAYILHIRKNC
jgi:hypothetical protein